MHWHALTRAPQLIVTELRLPRIEGYSLCGLLREEAGTHAATILVVTASTTPAQLERARRAGADDVLVKPIEPDLILARAINVLLRSRRLCAAAGAMQTKVAAQLETSGRALAAVHATRQRMMSLSYRREMTATPPMPPPAERCAACDRPLAYDHSYVGGVNPRFAEQWDLLRCDGCGHMYEYRHRTRRLRGLSGSNPDQVAAVRTLYTQVATLFLSVKCS